MHKIKNLTNSPYDLESASGVLRLPAMGEVTDEFDAAYIEALSGIGLYDIEAVDGEDPELTALRGKAEKLGIDVDGRWGPKRLQAEIKKAGKE